VLRSGQDHRHSLRRGRFTLEPYSQGPGSSRRNVVGAGGTAILMVKLMVKLFGSEKPTFPENRKSEGTSKIQL
jgi:hypothetical protein